MTSSARRITGEMLALLGYGYSPFTTIALWCHDHGFIRVHIEGIIEPSEYPCPICKVVRACSVLPAIGLTRQPLPRFDVVIGPISEVFHALTLESFDAPPAEKTLEKRKCEECGDRFQPRHGSQKLCGDLCSSVRASRRAARRYANRVTAVVAVAP